MELLKPWWCSRRVILVQIIAKHCLCCEAPTIDDRLESSLYLLVHTQEIRFLVSFADCARVHQLQSHLDGHTILGCHVAPIMLNGLQDACDSQFKKC